MQLRKLSMVSKCKQKDDEILTKGIVEIYKEILRGDRVRFPAGTWQRPDSLGNAMKCIKYLIEERLKLSDEDIKEKLSIKLFINNKLRGMLHYCFDYSPFEAINIAYPNKFKPWELKSTPRGYWTKESSIQAVKWLIEEKLKLSDEELKKSLSRKLFEENNLLGMLHICFNGSPFEAINAAYPSKFKQWELKTTQQGYWTKENGILVTKWLIEEKLKLSDEELKEKLSIKLFIDNKLLGMLNYCFNNSPYEAINAVYPNKFKMEDFACYKFHNKEESIKV